MFSFFLIFFFLLYIGCKDADGLYEDILCCYGPFSEFLFFLSSRHTGCLKIREFRIQSVVGDHFSSPNMEMKKNRDSPHKDTLV
jgi:hypothetical protein